MKFAGCNHYRNRPTDEVITLWAKLYQGQGSMIQQMIQIDVKPVLPPSECGGNRPISPRAVFTSLSSCSFSNWHVIEASSFTLFSANEMT